MKFLFVFKIILRIFFKNIFEFLTFWILWWKISIIWSNFQHYRKISVKQTILISKKCFDTYLVCMIQRIFLLNTYIINILKEIIKIAFCFIYNYGNVIIVKPWKHHTNFCLLWIYFNVWFIELCLIFWLLMIYCVFVA